MSNQQYNMFIDVGGPLKKLPKKKIYSSEKFIIMLIPEHFQDMVTGYYNALKKTPKYLSWHKRMPQYESWVDEFCDSLGRSRPTHLYHGRD